MSYLFKGENFGFTDEELHLQGGNSGFQRISLAEISKINICNGMLTVNPIRTSVLGLLLILVALTGVYWAVNAIINVEIDQLNSLTIRGFGGMLACIGLIFIVGGMAFSLVVSNRIVLKMEMFNGSVEIRSLKVLEKKDRLPQLLAFLTSKFSPQILYIELKILDKLN